MNKTTTATFAVLGAAAWTGVEYGLHRFVMHEKRGPKMASREHLQHHADVTYFSPTSKKLLSAAATTAAVYPVAHVVLGRRAATAFTAGMISTYFGYEVAHRRIHTHAPINRWGRWMRRHHLRHHFGSPMRNHAVTTPLWDTVFRTTESAEVVTVPRRMAPVWLLDANGEVKPEYAADYVAKGRKVADADDVARDYTDAFANRAPVAVGT